jgi:hypothetical protein
MSIDFGALVIPPKLQVFDDKSGVSSNTNLGRRGKASKIIDNSSSTGRDEGRPTSSLKGSKICNLSPPNHFAEDTETIRMLNDHEASEFDNSSTPPGYSIIPRKGKGQQNKSQPDNDCLLPALENQKNGTHATSGSIGPMGRALKDSSQHPYHEDASRSQDRRPTTLETTPTWTPSQSSSFRKHNNNSKTYGVGGKCPFMNDFPLFNYFVVSNSFSDPSRSTTTP